MIPSGGLGQGILDDHGTWIERSELVAVDENGSPAEMLPSSFDDPIILDKSVSIEEFLDHYITAIYTMQGEENCQMSLNRDELKDKNGYFEGDSSSISSEDYLLVTNYKRRISGNFSPINISQIESKLTGPDFCVTRKLDGELMVVFYDGTDIYGVGTGGKVRVELPSLKDAASKLSSKNISDVIFAAELYVDEQKGRSRIYDVVANLGKDGDRSLLKLAVLDVLSLNNESLAPEHYRDTHQQITEIFGEAGSCHAIPMKETTSRQGVSDIAQTWVEGEHAEGIIVHSELPIIFKIKPKHTFDVVILGYTEGDNNNRGKIRDILVGLMTDNGSYQLVGKTGNGFTEEQKTLFFEKLSVTYVESQFLETDSRHIAYHMVKPEVVVEISANDFLTESSKGIKENHLLGYHDSYRVAGIVSGVSLIHPVFERLREDKSAEIEQVNIKQITDLVYVGSADSSKAVDLPESELLFREVYVKESKGQKMLQKFLVWKTNKSDLDFSYPAYVMNYTNFSPTRKDPLKRDVRVSSSKKQIFEIKDAFVEKNVKKGWVGINH